jgi:hypothetical protein
VHTPQYWGPRGVVEAGLFDAIAPGPLDWTDGCPMQPDEPREPVGALLWRWLWVVVFCAHALVAVQWLLLMPGGFPVFHLRFWSNRVLPLIVLLAAIAGVAASLARRTPVVRTTAAATALLWVAAGVAAWMLFPISARGLGPFALVVGLVLLRWATALKDPPTPTEARARASFRAGSAVLVLVGLVFGLVAPWSQRGEEPSTRPARGDVPTVRGSVGAAPTLVRLTDAVRVRPTTAQVVVRVGGLTLEIEPLLTFESRSPDRCWTLFAPPELRAGPDRRLEAREAAPAEVTVRYADDAESVLRARAVAGGAVEIEAWSRLDRPVFSHLNSWCAVLVSGHRRLSLGFAPAAGEKVEALPADYPSGRPARFAYLNEAAQFHVVEAQSGEKGPFRALASGSLGRDDPLTVVLYDEQRPACRVLWRDWARQAATALSPTAGWGVPVNSIEFERAGEDPAAPVPITLSLAATSVGRGWDTVGHSPGLYVNRMRIEPVK